MGSALFVSIKDKPSDLDTEMNGKALARAWDALDAVADSLGVPKLDKLCNNSWKAPEKGLPVFQKYLEYVQHNPAAVSDASEVIDDLNDVLRLIGEAQRLKTKWRLLLDY